ncbi:Guanine nucleotide-binding protein alpha-4 subunit [Mycena sanguinolenta]|uniref:Guanine nucleotide-binding protein alpha-4 subunit n=1 Tax=Mycena sanguinolenta TaxID=230812 RepID=A0A8H7CIB7_9AGAR|nr:Guanine nucleotide-binding protein alpha-4 subunit [Mycena sanguinolenta]
MHRYNNDDPLDVALRPPPNESPEEAALREAREEEARRVSAQIDAEIKAERQARRKKRIVRLLLLGQSESGKSTTLRQFQRLYTPTAFREERIQWRAVIQLNIVRSIRTILHALEPPTHRRRTTSAAPSASMLALAGPSSPPPVPALPLPIPGTTADITDQGAAYPSSYPSGSAYPGGAYASASNYASGSNSHYPNAHARDASGYASGDDYYAASDPESDPELSSRYPSSISPGGRSPYAASSFSSSPYSQHQAPNGNPAWDALRAALLPLRHVEALLIARLVPPSEDEPTRLGSGVVPGSIPALRADAQSLQEGSANGWSGSPTALADVVGLGLVGLRESPRHGHEQEIFVRPGNRWMGGGHAKSKSPTRPSFSLLGGRHSGSTRNSNDREKERDEAQETLHACAHAMIALWADPGVREVLKRRKIRLEEGPGFFLNDLERVTGPHYLPTDDDVLRARLKTVGVAEYTFEMEVSTGRETGTEWRIIDVGGSRSQVATWVPFFDDVDAIIFLAPIAGFDQVLAEDRTVNRLEDSVLLWKAVCSNKLLAGVDLVLFLNKCDILERKLKAGVKLVRYVRSYAERENTFEAVSQYLRSKFSAIHREYSPNPRKFYAFCTSVTDTTTTGGIIASVRDMVVRQHLKQSKLL